MKYLSASMLILISVSTTNTKVVALPQDQPEEILRTEIILEGRSPIDGEPVSAEEYIIIQDQISQNNVPIEIKPEIKELIFLLRLRKVFKNLTPF